MMFGTVMMSQNSSVQQPAGTGLVQPVSSVSHVVDNHTTNKQQQHQRNGCYVVDETPQAAPTLSLKTTNYESSSTSTSTANNLRKQVSHQTQRQISERSVNFGSSVDEENYSKIKIEKRQARRENKRQQQRSVVERHNGEIEGAMTESKINVQILPQEDNWGENTTAFTADLSDFNDDNMTEDGRSGHFNFNSNKRPGYESDQVENLDGNEKKRGVLRDFGFYCGSYFGHICAACVSFCAFVTPFLFVLLPRLNVWQIDECGLECESLLVGIAFKLFILLIGAWALFFRKPRTQQLPRIYELRTLLLILLSLLTFSYWLFYAVRIIDQQLKDYHQILAFTVSYVDVLLFIFIIGVFIMELRHSKAEFVVRIVRSPDGEQHEYNLGKMSVQRAAVWLLEQYYKDFAVYNPWLESTHRKRSAQLLKLENKDRRGKKDDDDDDKKSIRSRMETASMVGGNVNANDRFYEEYEYERRVRKRRARLLTTTEEAFTHVRRIQGEVSNVPDKNGLVPAVMDPFETAQAVFTSIARDLRRYLRVTRQQPYFTRQSIVAHLANCISYDMSPRSFLQRYLSPESLAFNERALVSAGSDLQGQGSHGVNYHLNLKSMNQPWILICDTPLYQNCEDNLMFVLKQDQVSIMCTFRRLPRFKLIEDILDPQRNKFVIKFNSETTV